jgi:YVTN family beta-propeller protein
MQTTPVACGYNRVWVNGPLSKLVVRSVLKVMLITWCLLVNSAQAQTRAYVTNGSSNTISVIDTASETVVATIPVGVIPFGVAITPDGTRAYVTNIQDNTVSVIDSATNTVIATIPVGNSPEGIAITPNGARA